MSRPDPVDTLPHLTTAALLRGIETAAAMLQQRHAPWAPPAPGTEGEAILTSLLHYTECVEARLRARRASEPPATRGTP